MHGADFLASLKVSPRGALLRLWVLTGLSSWVPLGGPPSLGPCLTVPVPQASGAGALCSERRLGGVPEDEEAGR